MANVESVKLYCPKCEDTYNPKSSRHASIDGAYFGTSYHNILFQVYPALVPEKSIRRYEPRVFGFRIHAAAALARWQDHCRRKMQDRLNHVGVDAKFIEESDGEDEDDFGDETEEGDEFGVSQQRFQQGAAPSGSRSSHMDI